MFCYEVLHKIPPKIVLLALFRGNFTDTNIGLNAFTCWLIYCVGSRR